MKEIETVKNEIQQRQAAIKEMEEKLKEARMELRQFEKYCGLKYDAYREYGAGKYYDGMAKDELINTLRKLALCIVGVEENSCASGYYLNFEVKQVKELNFQEKKLCNDFLEEIYPIIAKYMDIVLNDNNMQEKERAEK